MTQKEINNLSAAINCIVYVDQFEIRVSDKRAANEISEILCRANSDPKSGLITGPFIHNTKDLRLGKPFYSIQK